MIFQAFTLSFEEERKEPENIKNKEVNDAWEMKA